MEKRENFSRKRTAILNALQETDVHPTADWVYAQLKPRYPNLSLGTVYRNLKKFCENGKAVSVGVINGQEHFDGNVKPHAHLCAGNAARCWMFTKPFLKRTSLPVSRKNLAFPWRRQASCSAVYAGSAIRKARRPENFLGGCRK